jgi:hypothetical protein
MSDSENPFGTSVTNLSTIPNVFLVSEDNQVNLWSVDLSNTFTSLSTTQSANMLATANPGKDLIKRCVAADMDGNGRQEVIVAMFSTAAKTISFYQITDGATQTMTLKQAITWNTANPYSDTRDWYHRIDLAAGDIDGDGKDEILITSENYLYILDDTYTPITVSDTYGKYSALNSTTGQCLRVECGDLDGDGRAEIVIANGDMYNNGNVAEISILKYTSTGFAKVVTAQKAITTSTSKSICAAEVKIGDVDGDGYPEIVLAGISYSTTQIYTMIMKPVITGGAVTSANILLWYRAGSLTSQVEHAPNWDSKRDYDSAIPDLAVGDLDGDGKDEIASNNDVLVYDTSATDNMLSYAFSSSGNGILLPDLVDGWWDNIWYGTGGIYSGKRADTAYYNQMFIGDINGDGNKEIVVLDYLRSYLRIYSYVTSETKIKRGANVSFTQMTNPFLCLANIKNNSDVVEYVGHTLTFSQPIISAVLASPPYYSNKNQNTSGMYTSFGKTNDETVGGSVNLGFSSGGSIGAKAAIPVVANGEIESKVTVTHSVDLSFSAEDSYGSEISFQSNAGHNSVIFTAVPVDVYTYKVISVGASTTRKVGDLVNVLATRQNQLYMTNVDFYNANNGSYPDIDSTVFAHTIGNPHSYSTKATATSLLGVLDADSVLRAFMLSGSDGIVPHDDNYLTLSYHKDHTIGSSFTYTLEVTRELEVSFIVVAGIQQSISVGFTIYGSVSTGENFSGCVGGLNGADYTTANCYNWGMYVYKQALSDKQKFTVVNYWVQ